MPVIEGSLGAPLESAGVPGAGTTEVQTLTIGGTPTGGSFKISFGGFKTAAIPWNSTNATLLASINSAIQALPSVGTNNWVATAGTLTAGIGTVLLTFAAALANRAQPLATVESSLTGTSPTAAITETTPGVDAFGLGSRKGGLAVDTTNGKLYINTGTSTAPVWTVVGTQT